jgi:hypothetical protein
VRTPVHHQFTVHLGNGEMIFNKAVSIPAKKRLMIEHVSGTLSLPSPQLAFVSLQTTAFQIDIPGGTTTGTHFSSRRPYSGRQFQRDRIRDENANPHHW